MNKIEDLMMIAFGSCFVIGSFILAGAFLIGSILMSWALLNWVYKVAFHCL